MRTGWLRSAGRAAAAICVVGVAVGVTGCNSFLKPHQRGQRAMSRGDYSTAVEAYTQAIEQNDYPIVAYANRCHARDLLNDREAAYKDCTSALNLIDAGGALTPEAKAQKAEILNNRGVVLIELSRYPEAIDDFTAALDLVPDYSEAYANRGRALVEQEKYDDAIADLEKAIDLKPDLPEAYGNLAQAYVGLGDPDQALTEFAKAIDVSHGDPQIYFERAGLLYAIGRFTDALADYREVSKRSKNEYLKWMADQQVLFLKGAAVSTPGAAGAAGSGAPADASDGGDAGAATGGDNASATAGAAGTTGGDNASATAGAAGTTGGGAAEATVTTP